LKREREERMLWGKVVVYILVGAGGRITGACKSRNATMPNAALRPFKVYNKEFW
jgi:hypothetical protein